MLDSISSFLARKEAKGRSIFDGGQVDEISPAAEHTAAAWSELVTGNFWQKALFRAHIERLVQHLLTSAVANAPAGTIPAINLHLQDEHTQRQFAEAANASGVTLPRVDRYFETTTMETYVGKGFAGGPDPSWETVYETPAHAHPDVFRIIGNLQARDLSVIGANGSSLESLLISAEGRGVKMKEIADRVTAFRLSRRPGQQLSPALLGTLRQAVNAGRERGGLS